MKVIIDKPAEFYDEVENLISAHYASAAAEDGFAKKYPVIYGLFLRIAGLGLRRKKVPKLHATGDYGLAEFQMANCDGCHFAESKMVGTGKPCCTYGFTLDIEDGKCLTRRTK